MKPISRARSLLNSHEAWSARMIILVSLTGSVVLSFLYRLTGLQILHIRDSDFLTAFPNYTLSKLLGKTLSLYNGSLAQDWMGERFWNYGPLHQFITVPLYFFSSVYSATTFLFFFLLFLYLGSMVVIYQLSYTEPICSSRAFILTCILLINYPFLSALNQRNLEIVELFFIIAAMIAYQQKNYFWAGVFIGLATGIKYLPGIIIIQFLVARNWNCLLYTSPSPRDS